jgi:di/tricarboxylate transporter
VSTLVLAQAAPVFSVDMLVVLGLIAVVLVLFITEVIPIDITALGVIVAVVLLEPWTGVGPAGGIAGFASPATITVLAMFVLSEGIRRTGVLRRVGNAIVEWARGSFYKQYGALIGLSGGTAGIINNTPVAAMMIPMAVNIARKTKDVSLEAADAHLVSVDAGQNAHADWDLHLHFGERRERPPVGSPLLDV